MNLSPACSQAVFSQASSAMLYRWAQEISKIREVSCIKVSELLQKLFYICYGGVMGNVIVDATMSLDWFINDCNGAISRLFYSGKNCAFLSLWRTNSFAWKRSLQNLLHQCSPARSAAPLSWPSTSGGTEKAWPVM